MYRDITKIVTTLSNLTTVPPITFSPHLAGVAGGEGTACDVGDVCQDTQNSLLSLTESMPKSCKTLLYHIILCMLLLYYHDFDFQCDDTMRKHFTQTIKSTTVLLHETHYQLWLLWQCNHPAVSIGASSCSGSVPGSLVPESATCRGTLTVCMHPAIFAD